MEDLSTNDLVEFAEDNNFRELVQVIETNELKGNALVDLTRETIKEILGDKATFGAVKNFESYVKKLRQRYEPEKLRSEEEARTPCLPRSLNEVNTLTPTTPPIKNWPFDFKYPIDKLEDDPILEKLTMPEMDMKSGDLTKIVSGLFREIRSYGDAFIYPTEEQYTQAARSAVLKWPHLEQHYGSIRRRLKSQFIQFRRDKKSNPVVAAKKLKFTPKSKQKNNNENIDNNMDDVQLS